MAREWHPIEEFTASMSVMRVETNSSWSDVRDRLLSTLRLRGDSSEGLQGGGGFAKAAINLCCDSTTKIDKGFLHVADKQKVFGRQQISQGVFQCRDWSA
jgi:hypothetical protein